MKTILFFFVILSLQATAQDGLLDTTFNKIGVRTQNYDPLYNSSVCQLSVSPLPRDCTLIPQV